MADIYLSPEGYEALKKELDFLRKVRRRELSAEIGRARELGDLRENAEYAAAKESQALNEKRIAELSEQLAQAQVFDSSNMPTDVVLLGVTVRLKDMDNEREVEYTLVAALEADIAQKKISISSPVAKALLGHKLNDVVEIKIPAGAIKYKIIKIFR